MCVCVGALGAVQVSAGVSVRLKPVHHGSEGACSAGHCVLGPSTEEQARRWDRQARPPRGSCPGWADGGVITAPCLELAGKQAP